MNYYTVLWTRWAEQQLANHWLNAPDRNAVTEAANTIDAMLRQDPHSCGESRSNDLRILFVPPLVVLFKIRESDRVVLVTAVKTSRRQK